MQNQRPRDNTPQDSNTCHWCRGTGHWARDCPSRKLPVSSTPRPSSPKVMVTMEDAPEEETSHKDDSLTEEDLHDLYSVDQAGPDLTQLSLANNPEKDHEEDEEGNSTNTVSDSFVWFSELRKLRRTIQWDTGQLEFKTPDQRVRIGNPPWKPPKTIRTGVTQSVSTKSTRTRGTWLIPAKSTGKGPPDKDYETTKLHKHEFVSVEQLIQAALEDGPISFMLLDTLPLSLPSFGFVPTGNNRGVEMEVEPDKPVTLQDIPEPYQHLQEVFNEVEADKLLPHTEHDLRLELSKGSKPPQGPLYLKGPKEMAKLCKYLDENLAKGFIQPSRSLARSPVLFVPKKDGGLRLCIDYQGLNEITIKNRAPLPLIEEQLFLLCKARIYSKLDLKAAYNLICIANRDEWKTTFGTQLGLYKYLVMPFGLANASAHFQSFINHIFHDIIGIYVVVYLDDFLIFSDTEEEHIGHVTEILTCLKKYRLFAKLSKCGFHTDTIEFLGYIIKPTGIEMDQEKV
ncbi:uncharacterized protein UBRO_20889 [Ustilago bromivora]|uniref:Retrotransposon nucleocapsid protein n=1 Tax=Ustilago bromivora TaxID=307758 RepID=A0A1K0HAE1_9BASI|nr:uncharacterized protein UBRO_20889 [Ustilago bromivora]